ncbi:MAG: endonuclease domain-containing protein [Candidatus Competibacterales bacterium]|nr:endonuclease domain-containing protein [Candidatus Competibacterales bacterium]
MTRLFNQDRHKQKRRQLRAASPPAEQRLWRHLRCQQLGARFRRQYGIGGYVVDFYCPALKLAIEIDGDSHYQDGAPDYDRRRQAFIEAAEIRVLRFTNREIYEQLDDVLAAISETIQRPWKTGTSP